MTPAQKKQKVTFAFQQFSAGKLEQAESLCRDLLADDNHQAEAWFVLGWVHRRRKQNAEAIECFEKAASAGRNDARFHNALGAALAAVGRFNEAAAAYRRAIELQPTFAEAHGNLARTLWLTGDNTGAEQAYQTSLRLAPALAEAHGNYGNFLRRTNKPGEAISAHTKAISLKPNVPEFHLSLGLDYASQDRHADAAPCFARALQLRPDFMSAAASLGHSFHKLNRNQEALACFDRVIEKYPDHPPTRLIRASLLEALGQAERAIAECKEALRLAPGWTIAELNLAAMQGGKTDQELPKENITSLFDGYADSFENHLLGELNYHAPQLVHDALAPLFPEGRRLDVIDLGCGTGLVGALLRPYAASLAGVDLAPKMIERARVRGIYDHLEVGDVTDTLLRHPGAYDLVVAGDVFVYIGDLYPVFKAVHAALRPGGLFAFTVEAHDGDEYVLRPSRRFAHSEPYIHKLALEHALPVASWTRAVLRTEARQPVHGFIVVLRRND